MCSQIPRHSQGILILPGLLRFAKASREHLTLSTADITAGKAVSSPSPCEQVRDACPCRRTRITPHALACIHKNMHNRRSHLQARRYTDIHAGEAYRPGATQRRHSQRQIVKTMNRRSLAHLFSSTAIAHMIDRESDNAPTSSRRSTPPNPRPNGVSCFTCFYNNDISQGTNCKGLNASHVLSLLRMFVPYHVGDEMQGATAEENKCMRAYPLEKITPAID
jgi:hypothetical protein